LTVRVAEIETGGAVGVLVEEIVVGSVELLEGSLRGGVLLAVVQTANDRST